ASKLTRLKLICEVNKLEIELDKVETIIRNDATLSYKLLRYINTAYFGLKHKVDRIRQAINLLGQRNLRKWVSLAALTEIGFDKPPVLLVTAMVRARFCELMAAFFNAPDREDDLFLMGLFSTIDALLDVPMEMALREIPLADDLRAALLGEPCKMTKILNAAIGYDAGDWGLFEASTKGYVLDEKAIPPLHIKAVKMAEDILNCEGA
ncbi:MAG: HDOD domain-containing protein, partial [Planctomycetota bacterium]